jgi:hypothetical protein
MRLIEDPVTKVRFFPKAKMGSYPSWLRRFTVNKLAMATACSTHAYPTHYIREGLIISLGNAPIRVENIV